MSILTISFNQVDYLRDCIQSVSSQGSEVNYEHIIIDPGSTDGSREYVASLADPRIRMIFEPDLGPADGLNKGLVAMRGAIMMYINADDMLAPGALVETRDWFSEHKDADVMIGNGWLISREGRPLRPLRSDRFSPIRYAFNVGNFVQQATAYRKSALAGVSFNIGNRFNWDAEFMFDLHARQAKIVNVNRVVAYFRQQPNSITFSGNFLSEVDRANWALRARTLGGTPKCVVEPTQFAARVLKRAKTAIWALSSASRFPGTF